MFGIGSTELLVILVVALVVLGPKSLPGIAKTMGKVMGEFRKVTTEFQRTMNAEVANEEHEKRKQEAAKDLFGDEEPVDIPKKDKQKVQPDAVATPVTAPTSVATPTVTTAETDVTVAPAPESPLAQALAKAEAEAAEAVAAPINMATDKVKDKA